MTIEKYQYRLYGRTRGRSNKKINLEDYKTKLNKFKIFKLDKKEDYILDIGTGYGETSIFLSKNYPEKIIIACEKYIDGNINLLKKIDRYNLKNIKLFGGNVNKILEESNIEKYFSLIWIFFPDPWPKKKHFKRRLLTSAFLKKLHTLLKFKGRICIATDSVSYTKSILKVIFENQNLFDWTNQTQTHLSIKDNYNLETKFYKKAINSGRNPILFILEKI